MAIINGFYPTRKALDYEIRRAVVANAVGTGTYTIGIGSAIQPGATAHTGYVTGATSSNPVLGTVTALIYQGKVTEVTSIVGVNAAQGTSVATAATYTDNETSGNWLVEYIPSNLPIQYSATLSATSGTTTNSGGAGWFNLTAVSNSSNVGSGTLDESSVAIYSGTQGQFWSAGVNTFPTAGTAVTGHWSKVL